MAKPNYAFQKRQKEIAKKKKKEEKALLKKALAADQSQDGEAVSDDVDNQETTGDASTNEPG